MTTKTATYIRGRKVDNLKRFCILPYFLTNGMRISEEYCTNLFAVVRIVSTPPSRANITKPLRATQ
jgi:hypothetical protein